jgi:hypothetical protein
VGRRGSGRDSGVAMMEYVLIAIVVGLIALFAVYRFSASLGARWQSGSRQLERASIDSTPGAKAGSGIAVAEGQSAADRDERAPAEAPAPSDGKIHIGNFAFDFSTVLWLGIGFVAVTVAIVVRMLGGAAMESKPKS